MKVRIAICILGMTLIGTGIFLAITDKKHLEDSNKYIEIQNDGSRVNNSEELKKDKKYNGLQIRNAKLVTQVNNVSILEITIYNPMDKEFQSETVYVDFLKENGEAFLTIVGNIPTVPPQEEVLTSISVTEDESANAYNYAFRPFDDNTEVEYWDDVDTPPEEGVLIE